MVSLLGLVPAVRVYVVSTLPDKPLLSLVPFVAGYGEVSGVRMVMDA